jgi:diguanylate cyclase (GGDEF)-like protein
MRKEMVERRGLNGERFELLYKITTKLSEELELSKLLKICANLISETYNYSNCSILFREGDNLVIKAATNYPSSIIGKRIPIGKGVTGNCAKERKEILVPDVSKFKDYIPFDKKIKSELAVPIIRKNRLLGVLNIESKEKNAFSEEDVKILKILSNQLAVYISKAYLHTQLELANRIGIKITSIVELDKLLRFVVQSIKRTLKYDSAAIMIKEESDLVIKAVTVMPKKNIGMKIPIGKGITGKCAEERRIINIGDISKCDYYIPSGIPGIKSEIALPIIYKDELLGVLTIESKVENAFGIEDEKILSLLCSQIAVTIKNAQIYRELELTSITDSLTGVFNYRYFYHKLYTEIMRARRYKRPLSLIILDFDNFKMINDTYGHLVGDKVLRESAKLIRDNIRGCKNEVYKDCDVDTIARYGGEEFAIILPETPLEKAIIVGERLRKIIEKNLPSIIKVNGDLKITASFGVTSYRDEESLEEFVKRADNALYEAKRRGKNKVVEI